MIQAVEDMGKLDNTLIIYISGDNGSSAEGSPNGTPSEVLQFNGIELPVAEQMKWYDVWGSDQTYNHMAVAWTWAFDTPFKWTKQVPSFFGGTRQGMAISWPKRITDKGGIRNQFHHVIDIVPTLPGSDRHSRAGDGRRRRPEAYRGREHGLYIRQGQRQRAVDAPHPVFRDDGRAGPLQRRLDAERRPDPPAVAIARRRQSRTRPAPSSSSSTTSATTGRSPPTSPRPIRIRCGRCGT